MQRPLAFQQPRQIKQGKIGKLVGHRSNLFLFLSNGLEVIWGLELFFLEITL